jgi:hypothetical protein
MIVRTLGSSQESGPSLSISSPNPSRVRKSLSKARSLSSQCGGGSRGSALASSRSSRALRFTLALPRLYALPHAPLEVLEGM